MLLEKHDSPKLRLGHTMILSLAKFELGFGLTLHQGKGDEIHCHAGKILVGLSALLWLALIHLIVVMLLTQGIFDFRSR